MPDSSTARCTAAEFGAAREGADLAWQGAVLRQGFCGVVPRGSRRFSDRRQQLVENQETVDSHSLSSFSLSSNSIFWGYPLFSEHDTWLIMATFFSLVARYIVSMDLELFGVIFG